LGEKAVPGARLKNLFSSSPFSFRHIPFYSTFMRAPEPAARRFWTSSWRGPAALGSAYTALAQDAYAATYTLPG